MTPKKIEKKLQHDNDPKYFSKIHHELFQEMHTEPFRMASQSPDVSLTENTVGILNMLCMHNRLRISMKLYLCINIFRIFLNIRRSGSHVCNDVRHLDGMLCIMVTFNDLLDFHVKRNLIPYINSVTNTFLSIF